MEVWRGILYNKVFGNQGGFEMNIKERIDSNFRGNIYVVQDDKILCEYAAGFA